MSAVVGERMIDAVIFDVDGTLYSQEILNQIFNSVQLRIAERLLNINGNNQPTGEEIEKMRQSYLVVQETCGSFPQAYVHFGGDASEYKETVETTDRSGFLTHDRELRKRMEQLRKVVKIGLFTSTLEEVTENTCGTIFGDDWRTLFDAVLCCNTPGVAVEKPQKEAFEHVVKQLGTTPDRAVMVGDVPSADLVPAALLGMLTVQVGRTDYSDADLYVNKVGDFFDHIKLLTYGEKRVIINL